MSLLSMCCFVKKKKKKESFRFFSLARFLKLKIAARQQSIEICNARRYWSILVVYCVDIRLKVVFFFTVMLVIVFTVILMIFYCVFFIVYWSVIFYECIWFYLTVSESDIIKLFNQSNRWSLGMDKWFHPILYYGCNYLSMLGLKLNHVSKRGPRSSA